MMHTSGRCHVTIENLYPSNSGQNIPTNNGLARSTCNFQTSNGIEARPGSFQFSQHNHSFLLLLNSSSCKLSQCAVFSLGSYCPSITYQMLERFLNPCKVLFNYSKKCNLLSNTHGSRSLIWTKICRTHLYF